MKTYLLKCILISLLTITAAFIFKSTTTADEKFSGITKIGQYTLKKGERFAMGEHFIHLGSMGEGIAAIIKFYGKEYVYIENKKYGPYNTTGRISTAGKTWGFTAKSGRQWFAVINHKKYGPFNCDWCYLTFSRDGKIWSLYKGKNKSVTAIINGKEYRNISGNVAIYDREKLAYVKSKNSKKYVYISGQAYGPYDDIPGLFWEHRSDWYTRDIAYTVGVKFSRTGNRWFCLPRISNQYHLIINGKDYGAYDQIMNFSTFGENDEDWVLTARKSGRQYIVVNGSQYGPYNYGINLAYTTGKTGKEWMASPKNNNDYKYSLLIDGKIHGSYDMITLFGFSGENKVCSVKEGDNYTILVNDFRKKKGYGPYDLIRDFTFSPTGGRWGAIVVKDKKIYTVVDGREKGPFGAFTSYGSVSNICFSADEKHWGFYFLNKEGTHVIINGKAHTLTGFNVTGNILPHLFQKNAGEWLVTMGRQKENNKGFEYYIFTEGKKYGPFDYRPYYSNRDLYESVLFLKSGENSWACITVKEGNSYVLINGILVPGSKNTVYLSSKKIDGKDYFYWLTLRGRTIELYKWGDE